MSLTPGSSSIPSSPNELTPSSSHKHRSSRRSERSREKDRDRDRDRERDRDRDRDRIDKSDKSQRHRSAHRSHREYDDSPSGTPSRSTGRRRSTHRITVHSGDEKYLKKETIITPVGRIEKWRIGMVVGLLVLALMGVHFLYQCVPTPSIPSTDSPLEAVQADIAATRVSLGLSPYVEHTNVASTSKKENVAVVAKKVDVPSSVTEPETPAENDIPDTKVSEPTEKLQPQVWTIKSPNGRIAVSVTWSRPSWTGLSISIATDGRTIISSGAVDVVDDLYDVADGFDNHIATLLNDEITIVNDIWDPSPAWDRAHYNITWTQLRVQIRDGLVESGPKPNSKEYIFRVCDLGIAWRAGIQTAKPLPKAVQMVTLSSDLVFSVDGETHGYNKLEPFQSSKLSTGFPELELPITIAVDGDKDHDKSRVYMTLCQSGGITYKQSIAKCDGTSKTLSVSMAGQYSSLPMTTPWYVFVMGLNHAGELLENGQIIPVLNEPPSQQDADTTWIRPGRALFIRNPNTNEGKQWIDFAAEQHHTYVHFDGGWYGDQYNRHVSATKGIDGLNVQEVIAYGREKGVLVSLYTNQMAMAKKHDNLPTLYAQWGAKAVKFGYMHLETGSDYMYCHHKAMEFGHHQMIVDIRGNYRSRGLQRTYPYLLGQGASRPQTSFPSARDNILLALTTYVSGPHTYELIFGDDKLQTTPVHQMALSVIFFSPLLFLYWTEPIPNIAHIPHHSFFSHLPTTWAETRVIASEMNEYIVVLRRSSSTDSVHQHDWYLGAISVTPRKIEIVLDFLQGKITHYFLTHYADRTTDPQPAKANIRQIATTRTKVTYKDTITLDMATSGGAVLYLTPVVNPPKPKSTD